MIMISTRHVTAAAAASVLALLAAGCGGGLYRSPVPPPDSITFPTASTQGWLQQYGAPNQPTNNSSVNGDVAAGIATDAQGDVFVLDQTTGAFSGFANSSNAPQFAVTKFDSAGHLVWTQQFGTGAGDFPSAIATDPSGNIFVGGTTLGALPGFTNPNHSQQGLVVKLNSSGAMVWTQQFAFSLPTQVTSLASDPQGNVVVGGETEPYGSAYTGEQENYPGEGGYVSKLAAANGAVLWNQTYNVSNGSVYGANYEVNGVTADGQGNVIAVGGFPGSASSSSTVYLAEKLNGATGQVIWQKLPLSYSRYGTQNTTFLKVVTDAQGEALLGGVDQSYGYVRCTIAKLNDSSTPFAWVQEFGAAQGCAPGGIATDAAGDVVLTGGMNNPFFPAGNPPKTDDIFVAKLNASGTAVWLQQFGTGSDGGGNSIFTPVFAATDSQGRIDIAGTTQGAFSGFTDPNKLNQIFVTQFAP